MQPTTSIFYPTRSQLRQVVSISIRTGRTESRKEAVRLSAIPSTIREVTYENNYVLEHGNLALWNGHEFETPEVVSSDWRSYIESMKFFIRANHDEEVPFEYTMLAYHPIDPRVLLSDVTGATRAFPNEDNTGWLFEHCDQDYMRDRESLLVAAMSDAFAPMHRQLDRDVHYSLVSDLVDVIKRGAHEFTELVDQFHADAEDNLRTWARNLHIGYYHQYPHDAHINEPVETAIRMAVSMWEASRAADYAKISPRISIVLERASNRHTYETRWDKAARIAAAKQAALAATGTDPVDGYEYCYTIAASSEPITTANFLPDPTWPFDKLRDYLGGKIRGGQTYWDGAPATSQARPFVIRFRRPIPDGTVPGADIGSVAWEQA